MSKPSPEQRAVELAYRKVTRATQLMSDASTLLREIGLEREARTVDSGAYEAAQAVAAAHAEAGRNALSPSEAATKTLEQGE